MLDETRPIEPFLAEKMQTGDDAQAHTPGLFGPGEVQSDCWPRAMTAGTAMASVEDGRQLQLQPRGQWQHARVNGGNQGGIPGGNSLEAQSKRLYLNRRQALQETANGSAPALCTGASFIQGIDDGGPRGRADVGGEPYIYPLSGLPLLYRCTTTANLEDLPRFTTRTTKEITHCGHVARGGYGVAPYIYPFRALTPCTSSVSTGHLADLPQSRGHNTGAIDDGGHGCYGDLNGEPYIKPFQGLPSTETGRTHTGEDSQKWTSAHACWLLIQAIRTSHVTPATWHDWTALTATVPAYGAPGHRA